MESLLLVLVLCVIAARAESKCEKVYAVGISEEGKQEVVDIHNKYREMIAKGEVPNQPKGVNLLKMSYDDVLGEKGRVVSDQCESRHVKIVDERFKAVGQNLRSRWNSGNDCSQNWTDAVTGWFNEHKRFVYPDSQSEKGNVGHYKQVVWAESYLVGCDFICYYDKEKPKFPYTSLYTCNYGPGGNVQGQPPYETGTSGCEDLCPPN